jgi:hypothetical protein
MSLDDVYMPLPHNSIESGQKPQIRRASHGNHHRLERVCAQSIIDPSRAMDDRDAGMSPPRQPSRELRVHRFRAARTNGID